MQVYFARTGRDTHDQPRRRRISMACRCRSSPAGSSRMRAGCRRSRTRSWRTRPACGVAPHHLRVPQAPGARRRGARVGLVVVPLALRHPRRRQRRGVPVPALPDEDVLAEVEQRRPPGRAVPAPRVREALGIPGDLGAPDQRRHPNRLPRCVVHRQDLGNRGRGTRAAVSVGVCAIAPVVFGGCAGRAQGSSKC